MILLPEEDIFGDNTHIHIEPFNHTVIKSPYAKKKTHNNNNIKIDACMEKKL